ncbi:hypothetical protein NMG60_11025884 [Bertholletia excelsa]
MESQHLPFLPPFSQALAPPTVVILLRRLPTVIHQCPSNLARLISMICEWRPYRSSFQPDFIYYNDAYGQKSLYEKAESTYFDLLKLMHSN